MPSEVAVAAFERLTDPATRPRPRLAGYYAIESLRLEKGYRAFGRELGPDTSPVEAGLTFACKLGTAIPFRGREAVERHGSDGVTRRLVSLVVSDPQAYAWGGELLLRDGEPVGLRQLGRVRAHRSAGRCCSATSSGATAARPTASGSARARTRSPSAASATTPI